ncbi:hypothetical protein CY34DRAFT_814451, partial [Suillus luteus UH-Slu-Lm8-n1]
MTALSSITLRKRYCWAKKFDGANLTRRVKQLLHRFDHLAAPNKSAYPSQVLVDLHPIAERSCL